MDYGEILVKAWHTIWKHKILWLFGVLAGCTATGINGGGGGGGGGGGRASSINVQPGTWDFMGPSPHHALDNFGRTIANIPVYVWIMLVLALIMLGLILSVIFLFAGTLGQTGVVKGTSMADEADLDDPPLSFGAIFNALKPHYWKVLLLNLGVRLLGIFGGLILALPILLLTVCTCCLGPILLIPIGWFINVLVVFTIIAIIEEDLGIFEGIARAWQVITRNFGKVVVMFLILGVGGLIIGLIISLPLLIVPVPLIANLILTGARSVTVGLVFSVLLTLLFLPLIIFLSGVLQAFILAAWTLTFRRLTLESELEPEVLNDPVDEV